MEVELGVSSVKVPAVALQPGPIPALLIGHSKGLRKILLVRGLITDGEKVKGAKRRKAAKGQNGFGQT